MYVTYVVISVLVGTLYVALAYFAGSAASWGREGRWVAGFLQIYWLALVGGFAVQVAFAVLLRWLARASRQNGVVRWILFGAMLGMALPWAFARIGYTLEGLYFSPELQRFKSMLLFPLMGTMMYETRPVWVLAAVGAATGGTLRFVTRRLERWPTRSRSAGAEVPKTPDTSSARRS